ncbi:MAG: metallophosphoesterase family protein [bacterium]
MRTAFISDVHGNLEALTAVLAEISTCRVDVVHSLGDVIGYGANPRECLGLVASHCEIKIMGNHESAVLGVQSLEYYNPAAKAATEWTRQMLSSQDLEFIAQFKLEHVQNDVHLVHGSPFEPEQWRYVLHTGEAMRAFENQKGKLCFCGHSHIPTIIVEMASGGPRSRTAHDFEPDPDARYLINVGSVGQPRDNDPRACYVIFDHTEYCIEYHRVDYDIEQAQQKMKLAQLPDVLAKRLAAGV